MKKSMLLSTIAMIVVVVVALSTATFAWFSSFTSVTADTTLTISAGTAGIEVREIGADKQWTNTLPTLTTAMAPVAPVTDIAAMTAPTGQASNALTYTATEFFSATKKPAGIVTNGKVAATDNYIYAVFQVRNANNTASANIKITATVAPTAEIPTDQDKFAVNNTKVVITYIKGLSTDTPTPTATTIGTAFKYQMTVDGAPDDISNGQTFPISAVGKPSTAIASDTTEVARVNDASITVEKTVAAADNTASEWYTVGVYIWLDGHAADNYAAGASLDASIIVEKTA